MGFIKVSSFLFVIFFLINGGSSTTFTVVNQCNYTVWPGLLSGAGTAPLSTTGFSLNSSESRVISIPASWSGRIWGAGGKPPATLAEFTLNGASNLDFFDISLVDGYNIPVTIVPHGGAAGVGKCIAAGCAADLNVVCPPQLKLTMEDAAGFCCSGAFGTPDTCKASEYAGFFKKACPKAYSYAYDDGTSTFTCSGADYVNTFCP
ncbi:BnaCnng42000D [Brassica napus]|uniref:BnaCnng42000D protein n=1 Tax=Brassica napus TaxID=3708 RepID=A0A078JBZ0_BRANA|nr:BnaCnng42000D [Brassica napus]